MCRPTTRSVAVSTINFIVACSGAAARRVLQRPEFGTEERDVAGYVLACASVSPTVPVGWVDGGWNAVIVHGARGLACCWAEQVIDHHHRFSQRHRGELHPCCHVTHGVDVGECWFDTGRSPVRTALSTLGHSPDYQPQTVDVGVRPVA